jgi:hypothetical protein
MAMSESPNTPEQNEHLEAIIKGATQHAREVVGFTKEGLQRLFLRQREFDDAFIALFRRLTAKLPDYTLARSILGGDLITPEEIMTARPDIVYTEEQITELADLIPSADILKWCKANGCVVVAGATRPISLLEVRAAKFDHFYSKTKGWYANANQTFARDEKVSLGWLMIRKAPVPESTNKNWDEQSALISNVEYVPNVAEMSWFITIFYDVRGVRLFEKGYVRTSSRGSDGDRVNVGYFDAKGLDVNYYFDRGRRYDGLGLSSARQLSSNT